MENIYTIFNRCFMTLSMTLSFCLFGFAQICTPGSSTVFALSNDGKIRAFTNPATSGSLGTVINTTSYSTATATANAIGYNPSNGKFYYFQNGHNVAWNDTSSRIFVSYDPTTNAYQTLSTTGLGSSTQTYRGAVNAAGTGYYMMDTSSSLWYYSISSNTWSKVISSYVDQFGNDLTSTLGTYSGGDIAIDGNGNLWILAGWGGGSQCYVFKMNGPLPTTPVAGSAVLTRIAQQNIGQSPNGIAFTADGQLYISNSTNLFRLNEDFTISTVGAITNGGSGDLTSCAFPSAPFASYDFGDAPNSYGTLLNTNGARHYPSGYDAVTFTAPLMIGNKIDLEEDGFPNTNADGDDTNGQNDENSATFPVYNINSGSYQVDVPVANTTGNTATLRGWIDFNNNGVFDSSEAVSVAVPNASTSVTLSWTGISGVTASKLYYRLRIASNASEINLPTGSANGGEVEDGVIQVVSVADCTPLSANLQPYNGQTNTSQIFTNNNIGIGNSRITIKHQLYGNGALSTDRISDTHFTGEYGINLGHNSGNTTTFANRIETTISFSVPVKDLKFTLNDVDAGDHIRLMVYDSDNNLINISASNYTLYPSTIVTFQNVAGSSGEFYEPGDIDNPSNNRKATVDLSFAGIYISKIVLQYYDPDGSGSYSIAKFSGADSINCPPCNAETTQVPLTGNTLSN